MILQAWGRLEEATELLNLIEEIRGRSSTEAANADSSLHEADRLEASARDALSRASYENAWSFLKTAMGLDLTRERRLKEEFGFLSDALESNGDLVSAPRDVHARIEWSRLVWQVLAERNAFPLPDLLSDELKAESGGTPPALRGGEEERAASPTIKPQVVSAEEKGDQLEKAIARLFRTFFQLGEDVPWKIRQQKRGTQGGYDLSIEWSGKCDVASNIKVRCHIECKNYKNQITPNEVAEKLLAEPRRSPVIEHWILISPRSNPSKPVERVFGESERGRDVSI